MKTSSFKNQSLNLLAAASLIATIAFTPRHAVALTPDPSYKSNVAAHQQNALRPKIQLAILLDTSSSMDGLIDQTRNQLWKMVDEFTHVKKEGVPAILEVAVYEYGNRALSANNGYVRKVTGLTTDLDRVSEALFSLVTNGGQEYCGYSIKTATENLQWSRSDQDIKAIFIAGNEPFTQGPVIYKSAIGTARAAGITVNTIHAGSYQEGEQTGWREGAVLAGGDYMNIDHNYKIAHVSAPQDQRIIELNNQLNQTYVPYGTQGKAGKDRQMAQDANSHQISPALLAKRAKPKASGYYSNSQWDLVDAVEEEKVALETLDQSLLPSEMSSMDQQQQKAYISKQAKERSRIKAEISDLSKARERYVAKQQTAANQNTNTMDDALINAIRKQGKRKNFQFQSERLQ
jgi:hypothetical protein